MAGIDDVLERLLMDTEFAQRLAHDPVGALAGYELTQDDLALLSSQVSFDPGALSLVEERVSKAGMFGLLSTFTAGLGDVGAGLGPSPHMSSGVIAPIDSQVLIDPSDIDDPTGQGTITNVSIGSLTGSFVAPEDADPGQGILGGGGEISIKEVDPAPLPVEAHDTGGGGGAGSEVSIKEVDPAPQPGAEAHGSGGGEGAGSEVSTKEVDPGVPPDGDARGLVIGGGIGNPEVQPAAAGDGSVYPASLVGFNPQPDPPGVTNPGDGIIVQNGLTGEGIIVQSG